ncbi:MAG: TIGR04219 family outer membrane beta-barrel protein [Pseudomonadota bacterium]
MPKKPLAQAALMLGMLLLGRGVAAAPLVDVFAGVQLWNYSYSGQLQEPLRTYDFERDFTNGSEDTYAFFVGVEHAVPLLPNAKLGYQRFDDLGDPIERCPVIVPGFCAFDANVDLSHTDLTLYWQLLDNWLNLDLGVSVLYFSGSSDFTQLRNGRFVSESYSEIVPALYAEALFEVPTTDLSVRVTGNLGEITDNSYSDLELALRYDLSLGFAVELGYREQRIEFEDFSTVKVKSDADGVFGAVLFRF